MQKYQENETHFLLKFFKICRIVKSKNYNTLLGFSVYIDINIWQLWQWFVAKGPVWLQGFYSFKWLFENTQLSVLQFDLNKVGKMEKKKMTKTIWKNLKNSCHVNVRNYSLLLTICIMSAAMLRLQDRLMAMLISPLIGSLYPVFQRTCV